MRTHIYGNGWTCTCGETQLSENHVPLAISGALAAQHIANNHPIVRASGTHRGCLECECNAIYEPIVTATDYCACGHYVGKHDQFCSVASCESVIRHANPSVQRADGDIELLCSVHRAQVVSSGRGTA